MDKYKKTTLTAARSDGEYVIESFDAISAADGRLADLGFVKNTRLTVLGKAVMNATVAVLIRNSVICIRREQADRIFVKRV